MWRNQNSHSGEILNLLFFTFFLLAKYLFAFTNFGMFHCSITSYTKRWISQDTVSSVQNLDFVKGWVGQKIKVFIPSHGLSKKIVKTDKTRARVDKILKSLTISVRHPHEVWTCLGAACFRGKEVKKISNHLY